jgi:ADP-ribose pyrophosphatase YjhB (NUDIX family)
MEQNSVICKKVDRVVAPAGSAQVGPSPGVETGSKVNTPQAPGIFKGRRRTALLWSVGGTVFSAVGFIALALFEQYNDSLSELRHDLNHFNETSAELVKKEGLRRIRDHLKQCRQELQDTREARLLMQRELAASEAARKETVRDLQLLRERLAGVEGRQAAAPIFVQVPPGDKKDR